MKPLKFRVKAVIFDMDGVITNTMPDHHRAWRETLKKYDIHLTHYDIYSREGQPGDEALEEILQIHNFAHTKKDIKRILLEKEAYFKKYGHTPNHNRQKSFCRRHKRSGHRKS
jgi:beta-phosphoglucomutase